MWHSHPFEAYKHNRTLVGVLGALRCRYIKSNRATIQMRPLARSETDAILNRILMSMMPSTA
jgi:hypothetical protein